MLSCIFSSRHAGRCGIYALVATVLSAPLASAWAAGDWSYSAGGLVAVGPRFPGSDKIKAIVVPSLQARYKDFLVINPVEGIGLVYSVDNQLKLGASLGLDLTTRLARDDSRLNGLADIHEAGALRLSAKYRTGPVFGDIKLTTRLGSEQKRGSVVQLEGGYSVFATRDAVVDLGLSVRWMDSSFSRNFFGISPAQSAASGLKAFNAGSGLQSAGVFVSGFQRLDTDWTGFARLGVHKLQGDAVSSPITRTATQTSLLVGANYAF